MSTRASIAIKSEAGPLYGIYLHSDGDPDWAGRTLLDHFSEHGEVWKLIRLGNLSILEPKLKPEPGKPHIVGNPQPGTCLAYGRDRGDEGQQATKFVGKSAVKQWKSWSAEMNCEWVYLYDETLREWFYGENVWRSYGIAPARQLKPLAPAVEPEPASPPMVLVGVGFLMRTV